jgi:alpha-galactosidase
MPEARFLGDHWERSYGDLEWRASVPNRAMPWYFLAYDGRESAGLGVRTGAASICFWQADPDGISLWLDVRNGALGAQLGDRMLEAAAIVEAPPLPARSPFETARLLCRRMCVNPRLPKAPMYGGNNWYYTYGRDFGESEVLRDSALLSDLAGGQSNRPFMVIDMGWSPAPDGAGPTDRGNARFPDMPGLAERMKAAGARPGIWMRPLLTVQKIPQSWRLAGSDTRTKPGFFVIDPSVPDALAHIQQSVRGICGWGFELIKHDFSTYDMLGQWGFEMGVRLTRGRWQFSDKSRTTAEIVRALYAALRRAAGEALLLGCNTIGHLGAGIFELQRIGDDTSGRDWERTRKMGVNTLAFRLPQHDAFFAADADCVPVTKHVPWNMTRQWLDLVARSGTPLFASIDPASAGNDQKRALKEAFADAASPQAQAEPLDWMETTAPEKWRLGGQTVSYDWYPESGASPFAG